MRAFSEMTMAVSMTRRAPVGDVPAAPAPATPPRVDALPVEGGAPVVYGVRVWIEPSKRPAVWARWRRGVPTARRAVVRSAGDDGVNVLCDAPFKVGERLALRPPAYPGTSGQEKPFSCVVEACAPGGTGGLLWVAVLRLARARNHG